MNLFIKISLAFVLFAWMTPSFAEGAICSSPNPFEAMAEEACCEERWNKPYPILHNHYSQIGYFSMPSALMNRDGTLTLGASFVHPYRNYSLGFQLFSWLELTGVYRVFSGVDDPVLSPNGFGSYADKGVNVKVSLIKPEDSCYRFPGVAIGLDDFHGSRLFASKYVVVTQVFPKWNAEISLGYGFGRLQGLFGGVAWTPWWNSSEPFLSGISFAAEYDATDYVNPCHEPHPGGRVQNIPINFGIKYQFWDYFNLSASFMRGHIFAGAVSISYPLGVIQGMPKVCDPLPYQAPLNWQSLCLLRPKQNLVDDLGYAFLEQGFALRRVFLEGCGANAKALRIEIVNLQWRYEAEVHCRITNVLASLLPSDIEWVVVDVRAEGVLCQEYCFRQSDLRAFALKKITECEMNRRSWIRDVTPPWCEAEPLFIKNEELIDYDLSPRLRTFFGSSKGKFKYGFDLVGSVTGYLCDSIFYNVQVGYSVISVMDCLGDRDLLNPSQLLNVNTDRIRYYQANDMFIELAYLQKVWNRGNGIYWRVAAGIFDVAYAGLVAETLYYPVNSSFAVGVEAAIFKKRRYDGWGFENKIRKWQGTVATYVPYQLLGQYFLNFYYDFWSEMTLKVSIGQFLARDVGFRTELVRTFKNGLKVGFWYTITNAHDKVNGHTYYDKGIAISIPLDFFTTRSSYRRWEYSLAAWLRDCGYSSPTGQSIYSILKDERE